MPSSETAPPIRVLYIGGVGRSGSTLLDRLLGQAPGWCSLGEVRDLWRRGVLEDRLCGCGARFSACPMWNAVGEVAYGGWSRGDAESIMRLAGSVNRLRRVPQLVRPVRSSRFGRQLREYAAVLEALYRAVSEVTGARVLVDSSKAPSYALVLHRVPSVDLKVAHLVRDSRGMAYSWTKTAVRPDADPVANMARLHPVRSAARWLSRNLLVDRFNSLGIPTRRWRYEDLVRAPEKVLGAIAELAEKESAAVDWGAIVGPGEAKLAPAHTVQGNPMRMRVGAVAMRVDDAWETELPARHARVVTALTWPLLRRYHYAGRHSS